MRRFTVLAVLLTCLAALPAMLPAVAADETPKAFLEKLYAAYVGPNAKGVSYDSAKVEWHTFTPAVIALMNAMYKAAKKADDVPALDGDPFVDAQDWDIKSVTVTVDQTEPDKATGHVSFKNLDEDKTVTLDLVHLKIGWRIDDVHWAEGSLRKLLTEKPD